MQISQYLIFDTYSLTLSAYSQQGPCTYTFNERAVSWLVTCTNLWDWIHIFDYQLKKFDP